MNPKLQNAKVKRFQVKFFLFIFLIHLVVPLEAWTVDRPFVSCKPQGQLGNQMLQIAATLAYAWDYGAIATFPDLNDTTSPCKFAYNRDRIFFRLNTSPYPRPVAHIYQEENYHIPKRIPFKPDQLLIGFFASWHHFHHHRNKLLRIFEPSTAVRKLIQSKYMDLLNHPSTVSVHVRTYNLEHHEVGILPFIGLNYYERAMNLFPSETIFVIFSDRINWCKKHFSERFKDKSMIFIDGNDEIVDLFLMSMMKSHIIANSSFSWWAAYLNKNPNKIVVSPRDFSNPNRAPVKFPDPTTIWNLEDWILLDLTWNEPYPIDIKWYDARSKSIEQ